MGDAAKALVAGVVTIGIITAAFLPGRQTVQGIGTAGTAVSGVLGTAING